MSHHPLRSTDKRRAGYSDNIPDSVMNLGSSRASRRNGTSKPASNEFHTGQNGKSKRST